MRMVSLKAGHGTVAGMTPTSLRGYPQSVGQLTVVSPLLQTLSPQYGMDLQSEGQLELVSPDWQIPSRVIMPVPTADRQKATVKVRIAFEELDPRILPDMGVKVAFLDNEPAAGAAAAPVKPAVEIPKAALRKDGDRDVVLVVRDGKVERRAVGLGSTVGDDVTVLSGLSGGEQVVIEGPADLKDGAAVSVKQ